MVSRILVCASFVLMIFSAFTARADEPKLLSKHGDWAAYSFKEGDATVCYMTSQPAKSEGAYKKRDKPFALITHRPADNTKNVFSYIAGYTYQSGSDVELTIDNKTFKLFTHKDMAWARNADADNKIAEAIQKGSKMSVKGTSARGTLTTDYFSLKGTGAAHDAINKACKVK